MKKLFVLLAIGIGLTSCDRQQSSIESSQSEVDIPAEAEKINDLLKNFDEPTQKFIVASDLPTQVIGSQGTIISINPADLVSENSKPIGKTIEVELIELTNQNQLVFANAQTVSNGKLLESGGAYYINLKSEGKRLKLRRGKTLKVQFPKMTDKAMALFYGHRDSLGLMNWKEGDETFKSIARKQETISKQENILLEARDVPEDWELSEESNPEDSIKLKKKAELFNKLYDAVELKSLGWINCDRFVDVPNKSEIIVNFTPSDSIKFANVYLIFKDINSVMQSFSADNKTERFNNIPIGYNVRMIAFTTKNDKIYSYTSDFTTTVKKEVKVIMKETTVQELKELIQD